MTSDSKTAGGPAEFETAAASSPQAVASFDDHSRGLGHKIQHALHQTPALVPMIVLLLSILIFGILLGSKFFSPFALTLILQQVQIVGVLAAAQSLVILTAGIDLSVGAIAVLTSVIMGQFTFRYGLPAPVSIFCGLCAGTLIGAGSGWLVARVKLPPFIVTLGMWQIVLAANYIYSANETIRSQDIAEQAPMLQFFGTKLKFGGATLTFGVIFMCLLVLLLAYILRQTAWGRHVYAVGDDPEAAKLAGVNTNGTIIQVYALVGLICAFAGWVMIGRFGSVSPSATTGVIGNIQAITAVVIGGISLFGGRGSILGAFFGALIVGVFELGLRMAGADPQWTFLLIGCLIIAATTVDQWIRKVSV
ncbi:MAG: ABC transporter permease [Roseibium sp.]|uniref:ABC transporter permease n=1 Tax=Roseibium sp. TaxID=1936156 RepID=UPI001B04C662|nr:ABC transporter permease [Roseibium sp.]MBO6893216.1 ABC transporter permease [Roseibium sp.]MBO6932601.1 ABC transporter permease [Roseibium sp.]